ncbi:MAG TPA: Rho termination factor N-terminal domain-containing protein [Gammaproteobacteria bacterium]
MNRKLAEDMIRSNGEYTKLRGRPADGASPRGTPSLHASGARGLRRPDLETWTTEELRSAATTLGVPAAEEMRRDELVEALLAAELATVRGPRARR